MCRIRDDWSPTLLVGGMPTRIVSVLHRSDCHGLQLFRSWSWPYTFPIVSSAGLTVVSSVT